jgi:hypothetical protein
MSDNMFSVPRANISGGGTQRSPSRPVAAVSDNAGSVRRGKSSGDDGSVVVSIDATSVALSGSVQPSAVLVVRIQRRTGLKQITVKHTATTRIYFGQFYLCFCTRNHHLISSRETHFV